MDCEGGQRRGKEAAGPGNWAWQDIDQMHVGKTEAKYEDNVHGERRTGDDTTTIKES